MTYEELKQAFITEKPVMLNGSTYKCVSAIIWRKDNEGGRLVQAELRDMNANSVTIADLSRVTLAVKEDGK